MSRVTDQQLDFYLASVLVDKSEDSGKLREAVVRLADEVVRMRHAIRRHRDYRGDDRCWKDNAELYASLPEGYSPPPTDTFVELENCVKYVRSCHDPNVTYVSPQRRIEELESELKQYKAWGDQLVKLVESFGLEGTKS